MQTTVNIKQVPLGKIRDLPEWPTEVAKVEKFRQLLRDGNGVQPPTLREVNGGETYEPLDGFHRYRALLLEGYPSYPFKIETCDDRTAEWKRIEASIDKPADVLMQRGIASLRTMFLRDMQAQVSSDEVLCIRLGDHGVMSAEPRRRKLPADPIETMLVLSNHFAAKCLQDGVSNGVARPESWWDTASKEWEHGFLAWLNDVMKHLQCDKTTIFSYLGFGLIPVEAATSGGQQISLWFRQLLRFGDEDVQRMILKRMRSDRLVPDGRVLVRLHEALSRNPVSAKQLIAVLGEWSLEDAPRRLLGQIKTQDERISEQRVELERLKHEQTQPADDSRNYNSWQDDLDGDIDMAPEDEVIDSVFAIVSPSFTDSRSQPPHTSLIIGAVSAFLATCGEYEAKGGTWDDASIQSSLSRLHEWLHKRS